MGVLATFHHPLVKHPTKKTPANATNHMPWHNLVWVCRHGDGGLPTQAPPKEMHPFATIYGTAEFFNQLVPDW